MLEPAPNPVVTVSGRRILVDGVPLYLKGVNWNPVARGGVHPMNLDFAGYAARDIPLMKSAGVNAVRTYEPLTDRGVLDQLWASGMYVVNTAYASGGATVASAGWVVDQVKDHPSILMWAIGNEWNYNNLYVSSMTYDSSKQRIREVARLIKQRDPAHPVSTIYGEVPSAETLGFLSDVDVWGINTYRGLSFGDLFSAWKGHSGKPMYLGEYGADAWNTNVNREDQQAQAEATTALMQEINGEATLRGGVCVGGFIFEFADEWWKDGRGSSSSHDTGGVAPGGGPHPDGTFNEEWWGLVDIDRKPRQAYNAFAAVQKPTAPRLLSPRSTRALRASGDESRPSFFGATADDALFNMV